MFSVTPRGTGVDRDELTREIESISAENQRVGTFRQCPKCGADHFTQHAVRGKAP